MGNIKILISCHKQSIVPDSEIMLPIEVGADLRSKHIEGYIQDNSGDNISAKNKMYCELTAQYWAWKNLDADYYGFFHYRRYLNFSENKYPLDSWQNITEERLNDTCLKKYNLNDDCIRNLVETYDLVLSEEKNIAKMPDRNASVYEQYKNGRSLNIRDLDLVRDIIAAKHPDYLDTFDEVMKGRKTCLCNMYIMKKELFHEYMSWLFDILFEFEKKADMSEYTVEGYRTPGHLAERLLTVFCWYTERKKNLRVKKLQTIIFLKTDQKMTLAQAKKTAPAFDTNNVAIAVAANDYFIPYCATFLKSMAEHSDSDKNYDILLLSQDVSDINVKNVKKMLSAWKNISLRVLDPSVLIDQYTFHIEGHFSKETYYRLVLPELLPNYDKVLYLDSDMIAMDDVAKIYDENIDGYLLAACHDADTAGLYNGYRKDKKDYTDKILKLKEPYQYFQAGVLLLNLEEFRKRYTTKQVLDFAVSEKWQLLDQDILNKLCEGAVKYIDMSWNVMVDFAGVRINQIIALAPRWLNEMYHEARKDPKIIHYAGPQKPWFEPEMDFGMQFWECARGTAYYEIMLGRMNAQYNKPGHMNKRKGNINIFHRGLQCVEDHGIVYTIGYLPKYLCKKINGDDRK
ncbi:DUF4422 domain-containing protein [Clostridium sp. MCC344]|nr:DUF4422 domain-containing protein [Clostridium sp. MCC344]